MANSSLHEHRVCSFIESEILKWVLEIFFSFFLPDRAERLAELLVIVLIFLIRRFCPYRE